MRRGIQNERIPLVKFTLQINATLITFHLQQTGIIYSWRASNEANIMHFTAVDFLYII